MLETNKILNKKFKKLVWLYLTNGLTPSDFADNIFIGDYKEISIKKKDNYIVMEMFFVSDYDGEEIKTKLKYYYDSNKKLLMIEEKNDDQNFKQIWNREDREEELSREIAQIINEEIDPKARNYFVNSLPIELKERLLKSSLIAA